jgi:hypothetical protein
VSEDGAKQWEGIAAPMSGRDARGAAQNPGPQAAAEMLCDLRQDAKLLLRSSARMQEQSAEIVKLQTRTLQLLEKIASSLESIDARLTEQKDDTENMMAQATDNTDKLVAALNALGERLGERG